MRSSRRVQLYPTGRAQENRQNLRQTWSRALEGTVDDPETIDVVNAALRRIENELIARRQRTGEPRTGQ
jgi:hypothetical protein